MDQPTLSTPTNAIPAGAKIRYPKLEALSAEGLEKARAKIAGGAGLKMMDDNCTWIRGMMETVDAESFRKTFEPPSPEPVDEEALERERLEKEAKEAEELAKLAEEEARAREEERAKAEAAALRQRKLAIKEAELKAKYEAMKFTPIAQLGTRASERLVEAGRALRVPGVKLDLAQYLPSAVTPQHLPPPGGLDFGVLPKLQKPTFKVVGQMSGPILGNKAAAVAPAVEQPSTEEDDGWFEDPKEEQDQVTAEQVPEEEAVVEAPVEEEFVEAEGVVDAAPVEVPVAEVAPVA